MKLPLGKDHVLGFMNICIETKYHVVVIYLGNVLSGFSCSLY